MRPLIGSSRHNLWVTRDLALKGRFSQAAIALHPQLQHGIAAD
jgi:hypothetical protein